MDLHINMMVTRRLPERISTLLLMLFLVVLHTLHHPIGMVFSILLLPLLRLHCLLHLEFIRDVHALLDGGTLLDSFQPALQGGEGLSFDAGPFGPVLFVCVSKE